MGRRERTLNGVDPLHRFAADLRRLRDQAGAPKYLVMARRSHGVSRTALAEAAGGDHLPRWRTVEGFVRACGANPDDWLPRYEGLCDHLHVALTTSEEAAEAPVRTAARFAVVVVQNKVALGPTAIVEDVSPAYLSSRPIPYGVNYGCKIPGTNLVTGTPLVAEYQILGEWMANYNLDSSEVRDNPNKAFSNLWYYVVLHNGVAGFLSEVYVEPASRGGMGLPRRVVSTDQLRVS
jgi:hypothetical protein